MSQRVAIGRVLALAGLLAAPARAQEVPATIVVEGVPPLPRGLFERLAPYRYAPSAVFEGWLAGRRQMLVLGRSAETTQVFCSNGPGDYLNQVTTFRERVAGVRPRPGRNQFAFAQDRGGDEQFQLSLFDLPGRRAVRLTDDGGRHVRPRWSGDGRRLAWSGNARNGKDLDVYVLDLAAPGPPRRLVEVSGLAEVADWSPDGRRLAVLVRDPGAGTQLQLIDLATGRPDPVDLPPELAHALDLAEVRWSKDGAALDWLMFGREEHRRLVRHDLATGATTVLTGAIPWDIDEFDLADDGRTLAVIANEDGVSRLHLLDATTGAALRPAPSLPAGQVFGLAFRGGSTELGFNLEAARAPAQVYSYLAEAGRLVRWTLGGPLAVRFRAAEDPELIHYRSFDGRPIAAYVYRPSGRFAGPRPVLIDVHGGPAAQFRPGFLGTRTALINELGLVLIHPNIRGSSGYGRSFLMLDNGARRPDAVRDLGALLDWIAARPDLDAARVAISGGSYGGAMALSALTRYGDRLRAGIDVAGISDYVTLLEGTHETARDLARAEFGDERDPAMRALLRRISPLADAAQIRVPLLVVQGENDPRVPPREAEQIIAAVRAHGVPVWSILARDEGHGFARASNQEYQQAVEFLFLKRFLVDAPAEGAASAGGAAAPGAESGRGRP
ncbi:MAG TPA: prolyl oligopeptidase family serine peptidase [Isosphaeraceae bacterium]|jgi:dipeptidyl aminopeptidase/acylaminoacyl peptidase